MMEYSECFDHSLAGVIVEVALGVDYGDLLLPGSTHTEWCSSSGAYRVLELGRQAA